MAPTEPARRVYNELEAAGKDGLSKRDLGERATLAGVNIETAVSSLLKAGQVAAVPGSRRYAVKDGAS